MRECENIHDVHDKKKIELNRFIQTRYRLYSYVYHFHFLSTGNDQNAHNKINDRNVIFSHIKLIDIYLL